MKKKTIKRNITNCQPLNMDGAKENWNRGNAAQNKKYVNPFRLQQQQKQNKKSAKNKQNLNSDQQMNNTSSFNRNSNSINPNNVRNKGSGNKNNTNKRNTGPFTQRIEKLQRARMYRMTRMRSKQIEQKNQNSILKVSKVITIDSSDEDNDDVIEIKLPPPPLVIVKDSSDESNDEDDNKFNIESETEKNIVTSLLDVSVEDNNSNNSDDFIGNADRFRLTQSDEDMSDQEEVVHMHAEEVSADLQDSNEDNQTHTNENYQDNDDEIFVSPQKKKKKTIDSNLDDYQVTQSNFRALDVYESESSDMPESVYAKGRNKGPSRASCSSSDVEEIDDNEQEGQKTKRLRKRRVSSNKGSTEMSDKNADYDTDEDDVSDEEKEKTDLPFISRGEAVENCKMKFSNKKRTKSSSDINKSDENFINILKNISQGGQIEDDGNETDVSNKSDDDNEIKNITARKIVEDVINKNSSNRNMEQIMIEDNSNSVVENLTENVNDIEMEYKFFDKITNEEDNDEDAIPEINVNLSQVLNIIDKLDDIDEALMNDDNDDGNNENENETDNDNPENLNINENDADDNEDDNDDEPMYTDDNDPQNLNDNEELETINTENYNQQDENESNAANNSFMKITHSSSKTYIGWNDEMIRFYDRSWGDQNLSVNQIRNSMNRNINYNSKWDICTRDRFPKREQRKFPKIKCYNCCEYGHTQARCPLPRKQIVCYMCGETGHKEPRCPNTICLRCGNKTRVFMTFCSSCSSQNRLICPICKIRGHSIDYCPDKWRRYHSTTIPNEYPNKNVVYKKQKFCCVCSSRGHLPENCRALQTSPYPIVSSEIKSHEKSYQDIEITYKLAPNVIAYNLFYEPNSSVNFSFSNGANIKKGQYYWRFLNAVGLNYILRRKIPTTNNLKAIELCESNKNETSNQKIEENVDSDVNINEEEQEKEEDEKESVEKDIPTKDNNEDLFEIEKNYIEGMKKTVAVDKIKPKSNNPLLRKVLQKNFEKLNKSMTTISTTATVVTNETEFDKDKNGEMNLEEVFANEFLEENNLQVQANEGSSEQQQHGNEIDMENIELEKDLIDNNETNNEKIPPVYNADKNDNENDDSIIIIDDEEEEDIDINKTKTVIVKSESSDENKVPDTEIIDCDAIEDKEMDDDDDDDEDEEDEDYYDYNYDEDEDEENILSGNNEETQLNLSNRSSNSDSAEPPPDFLMNIFIPNQSLSSNNEDNENDEKEDDGKQQNKENDIEKEISQLPDFIPFSTSNDDDDDDDCNEDNDSLNNCVGKGISHRLSGRSFDGDCTNFIPDKDMPGAAKIHLTNFHGKYLLTAEGQTFLNEKSKIYNIKVSISWTSQGNYLVINGLPKDRSRFHKDLLLELANIPDKSITRVEKHTRIPKKRLNAIKFLQKEILQLTKNLGNVHSLYTQYSTSKILSSKNGNLKAVRKDRRLLNMILLGQQGLSGGRQHLMALTNILKTLQENNYARIPDDIHLDIYNHWKFIFSSRTHENIHDLFKEYNRLKRQNQLIKFNLARVLGKNAIYVNFTRKHVERNSGDENYVSFDERCEGEDILNASNLNDNSNNNNKSLSSSTNIFDGKKNKVFNPFSLYRGLIPGINKKINDEGNKNTTEKTKHKEQKTTNDEGKRISFGDYLNTTLPSNSMMGTNSSTSGSNYCTDYSENIFYNNNNNNNSASRSQQNNIFENIPPSILQKSTTQLTNRMDISSSPPPKGKLSLPISMTSTPEKLLPSSTKSLSLESSKSLSSRSLSLQLSQSETMATATSFVSNKIIEIKKVWENQCENLINKIDNNKKKNDNSMFWSRECIKFIDLCTEEPMLDAKFKDKLHLIMGKAKKGELSYNDYMIMSKIHKIIKARNM